MRKGILLNFSLSTLLILLSTGCGARVNSYIMKDYYSIGKIEKVAVIGIRNSTGAPDIEKVVGELLITDLVKTGRYTVVERGEIEKIFKELSLDLSGTINQADMKKVGELAGVDAIFTGSVTQFESYKTDAPSKLWFALLHVGAAAFTYFKATQAATIGVSLRMVDVTTGKVLWSGDYTAKHGTYLNESIHHVLEELIKTIPPQGG